MVVASEAATARGRGRGGSGVGRGGRGRREVVAQSVAAIEGKVMSLWDLLDVDRDGVVSFSEWEAAFRKVDADGDGHVTRKEFSKWTANNNLYDVIKLSTKSPVISLEAWLRYFQVLDVDSDGLVSKSELRMVEDDQSEFLARSEPVADKLSRQGRTENQKEHQQDPVIVAGHDSASVARHGSPEVQGTWTAAQWLSTLGGNRSIARIIGEALAGSCDGDEQMNRLRALTKQQNVKEVVTTALKGALSDIADTVVAGIVDLVEGGGSALECNGKFQQDAATFGLSFGGLKEFFEGLEGLLGAPAAKAILAVFREHFQQEDSNKLFVTGNYGISTTSRNELAFVVAGDEGPDSIQEEKEFVKRIKEFQDEIDYKDNGGEVTEDVTRDETSKVLEAELSERLTVQANGTHQWHPVESPEKLKDRGRCRQPFTLKRFKASIQCFNRLLKSAGEESLSVLEFIGARLYTGPMFMKYNTVLRSLTKNPAMMNAASNLCGLNRYVTTLHVINSALLKMSKIQPAERVYRGMSGCFLPEAFLKPNQFNVRGGVEYAFMSTTTDRAVAVHYASGKKAGIVFEIQLGMVDRGASLRWLSQYPYEAEICFGPLSGMQVVGERVESNLMIVEIRLSVNLQSLTIEQVIGKRRKGLKDMCETLKMEVRAEFAKMVDFNDSLRTFIEREVAARFQDIGSLDVEVYNDDATYEQMFHSVLKTRQAPSFFLTMINKFGGTFDGTANPKEVQDGVSPLLLEGELAIDCPVQARSAFENLRQEEQAYSAFKKHADPLCETIINSSGDRLKQAMDDFSEMLKDQAHSDATKCAYVATKGEVVEKMVSQECYIAAKYASKSDVLAAMQKDWKAAQHVSESMMADIEVFSLARSLTLEIVQKNGRALEFANQVVKADREVVLAAVTEAGVAVYYADDSLKANRDFLLAAVTRNGTSLEYAYSRFGTRPAKESDKEVVLAAVKQAGQALKFASDTLQADREVVLAAITCDGEALDFASDTLKADKKVVLAAITQNGRALQFADDTLKADKEVVLAAVTRYGCALEYAADFRADGEVVLTAVMQDGEALEFASEPLRADGQIVLATVTSNRYGLAYASETVLADRDIVLQLVTQNGFALEYVCEPLRADRDVVFAAVTQAPGAHTFAAEPLHEDPEILRLAQRAAPAGDEVVGSWEVRGSKFTIVRTTAGDLEYEEEDWGRPAAKLTWRGGWWECEVQSRSIWNTRGKRRVKTEGTGLRWRGLGEGERKWARDTFPCMRLA